MFNDAELNQNELQRAFLRKVNKIAPEVRRTLAGEPLALYEKSPPPQAVWIRLSANNSIVPLKRALRGVEPVLAKSIEDWMQRWKLKAPWCRVSAYFTLEVWVENNAMHYRNCLFHPALHKPMKRLQPPTGLPRYYVEDGRNYYVEHLTEHLKATLVEKVPATALAIASERNAFIEHIIDQTIETYCKPAEELQPIVKPTERRELDKHLEWAVRVFVKREKQAAIVRELELRGSERGVTPPAVSLAIKSILKDLHLLS